MKSKSIALNVILAVAGAALALIGLFTLKSGLSGSLDATLGGLMVGVGCGLFGANLGSLISKRVYGSSPEAARRAEIEQNDERNRAISNLAKSKAFDAMNYIFAAVIFACLLMGAGMAVTLVLVCAYLAVNGVMIGYLVKFNKEM